MLLLYNFSFKLANTNDTWMKIIIPLGILLLTFIVIALIRGKDRN